MNCIFCDRPVNLVDSGLEVMGRIQRRNYWQCDHCGVRASHPVHELGMPLVVFMDMKGRVYCLGGALLVSDGELI